MSFSFAYFLLDKQKKVSRTTVRNPKPEFTRAVDLENPVFAAAAFNKRSTEAIDSCETALIFANCGEFTEAVKLNRAGTAGPFEAAVALHWAPCCSTSAI
ncbi:hypothetical protein [Salinisphaera sp.]|uniref:hypothetical protein n=1 Tax=Salinisphaera sp. TaxID=1914330 RepID=UPI0025FFBFD6|nr:hypothetical protein [Salinisphaera sp.]